MADEEEVELGEEAEPEPELTPEEKVRACDGATLLLDVSLPHLC